jgi:transcriptional regulator with XRE-family HTH domain
MAGTDLQTILATIGTNVRRARLQRGLTQEGLAAVVGLSPRFIQDIERAKAHPSLASLVRITNALEIPFVAAFRKVPLRTPRLGRPKKSNRRAAAPRSPA